MANCSHSGATHSPPPAVRADLRPSPALVRWSAGLHAGGALVALACALPGWVQAVLLALLLGSHLRLARQDRRLGGDAVCALVLDPAGAWQVATRRRPLTPATLKAPALLHPRVAVLEFVLADGRRRAAVLLSDNCDPEAFRLLRARLR